MFNPAFNKSPASKAGSRPRSQGPPKDSKKGKPVTALQAHKVSSKQTQMKALPKLHQRKVPRKGRKSKFSKTVFEISELKAIK